MELNIERTDETQASDHPANQHTTSLSNTLLAYLEGELPKTDELQALAQACGSPYGLVVFKPASHRGFVHMQDMVDFARSIRIPSVDAKLEDAVVIFLANDEIPRLVEFFEEKGFATKAAMAISLPFASVSAIPMQHELLAYCLDLRGDTGIVKAEENAFDFLTSRITSTVDVQSLLHPAIAKLSAYDRVNQSNLLSTLKTYLENDRNAQRCANLLYLHRNSLQYRVRRIQEIADIDLDNPEVRAYLRLSFMLSDQ